MRLEKGILAVGLVLAFLVIPNYLMSKELRPGDPGYKDPAIAALISFLVIGGGQIYVGDITRGLIFLFGGYAVIIIGIFALAPWFGYLAFLAIGVYNIYDAYSLAKKYNAQGGKIKVTEVGEPNPLPAMAY